MRRAVFAAVMLLLASCAVAQQPPGGGAAKEGQDDPKAVGIVDSVATLYRGLNTFFARYRQTDVFYSEWMLYQRTRIWDELRKRPNRMKLITYYPQELDLPPDLRLMGEKKRAAAPDVKDEPLRMNLVQCDGTTCYAEYYSLVAIKTPVGKGQADTETMAQKSPAELYKLKNAEDWPKTPTPDNPITIAEILDGADLHKRIVPGTTKMVTHKDDEDRDVDVEDVAAVGNEGSSFRPCYHVVFLLTNGLEQHWWVDTELSVIRAEMVVRVVPPAKDPYLESSPKVELLKDLTDLATDRLQRVRRYMTGRFVQTILYYDFLTWNFDMDDSSFTYAPTKDVMVVEAKELFGALGRVYESTTGKPAATEPPPDTSGDSPLVP